MFLLREGAGRSQVPMPVQLQSRAVLAGLHVASPRHELQKAGVPSSKIWRKIFRASPSFEWSSGPSGTHRGTAALWPLTWAQLFLGWGSRKAWGTGARPRFVLRALGTVLQVIQQGTWPPYTSWWRWVDLRRPGSTGCTAPHGIPMVEQGDETEAAPFQHDGKSELESPERGRAGGEDSDPRTSIRFVAVAMASSHRTRKGLWLWVCRWLHVLLRWPKREMICPFGQQSRDPRADQQTRVSRSFGTSRLCRASWRARPSPVRHGGGGWIPHGVVQGLCSWPAQGNRGQGTAFRNGLWRPKELGDAGTAGEHPTSERGDHRQAHGGWCGAPGKADVPRQWTSAPQGDAAQADHPRVGGQVALSRQWTWRDALPRLPVVVPQGF